MRNNNVKEIFDSPVHRWFSLTYSSYLVLPRLMLESMPLEWQHKLVALLEEADDTIDLEEGYTGNYSIQYKVKGKIAKDPYSDYRRGKVKYKEKPE